MEIVEYKAEDIGVIKSFVSELQDVLKSIEPNIISSGDKVKDSYTEHLLKEVKEKRGQIWLAKNADKAIGFIAVYINKEKDEEVEYLHISDVMVTQNERGKGVGKLLLKIAESYAQDKKLTYIRLGSLAANEDAARLYRSVGFNDYLVILQKKIQ